MKTILGAHQSRPIATIQGHIELFIVGIIAAVQDAALTTFRKLLFRKRSALPRKILIFRTGSIGDSVCALPAIASVKAHFANAEIDLLTNTGVAGLAGLAELVDKREFRKVINYSTESRYGLFKSLKHAKYDVVIQLPQVDAPFLSLLRDMIFFRFIARAGFGWKISQIPYFRQTQAFHLLFQNESERLLKIIEENGIPRRSGIVVRPSTRDIQMVEKLIGQKRLPAMPLIAVAVGGKREQNRWPLSRFRHVVEYFSRNFSVVIVGAASDQNAASSLAEISNVFNFCGELSVMQSAALLMRCRVLICNDSGPMHISYAIGTPTVAVFSSRDLPGKWFPPAGAGRVLRNMDFFCKNCWGTSCEEDHYCLKSISPVDVITAAEEILTRNATICVE